MTRLQRIKEIHEEDGGDGEAVFLEDFDSEGLETYKHENEKGWKKVYDKLKEKYDSIK